MKIAAVIVSCWIAIGPASAQPQPPSASQQAVQGPSELDRFRRATVSIGQVVKDGDANKYVTVGTGVIVATDATHACLLTAKHVVFNPAEGYVPTQMYIRLAQEGPAVGPNFGFLTPLQSDGKPTWAAPSDGSDLAVVSLPPVMRSLPLQAVPISSIGGEDDVFQSANILVLGYPVLLGEEFLSTPLARGGIISWTDPSGALEKPFLIDSNIFNGNSGGPVFHVNTGNTRSGGYVIGVGNSKLIGIVSKDAAEGATVYSGGVPVQSIDATSGKVNTLQARVLNIGGIGIIEPAAKARPLLFACAHPESN